jgi:hypothetical protein
LKQAMALSIVLCACVAVSGCGYTYATSHLTDDYSTIAVPAFKNKSFEPDIQILITNQLIRELQADGRLRIVDNPASADLVLTGDVTGFEAQAISLNTNDNIGQFKITILASASLKEAQTGKTLWEQHGLRGTDFYQTQGGRTREEGLEEASENLVETIIFRCFDSYW